MLVWITAGWCLESSLLALWSESSNPRMSSSCETCTLSMECESEALSESQQRRFESKDRLFKEQMRSIMELVEKGAKVDDEDEDVVLRFYDDSGTNEKERSRRSKVESKTGGELKFVRDKKKGNISAILVSNSSKLSKKSKSATKRSLRASTPPPSTSTTPSTLRPRSKVVAKSTSGSFSKKSTPVVDLTQVSSSTGSRKRRSSSSNNSNNNGGEVSTPSPSTPFSRVSSFPSLLVFPRVSRLPAQASSKRVELDRMVKALLVLPISELIEWFIQRGLIPKEKYCTINNKRHRMEMVKSSSDTHATAGGYVWVANVSKATKKHVSVVQDSILDVPQGSSRHSPVVILKLLYHWACQTPHTNVCQWVKVSTAEVNHFFTLMRGLCVVTVHNDLLLLGSGGKVVEVGVISLGTSANDGNRRTVKVEVLGVLERISGRIRLRANTPLSSTGQAERFTTLFHSLEQWVSRDARLVIDFSIDKDRIKRIGYKNVAQVRTTTNANSGSNSNTETVGNARVMTFLKKVVPKMFQNSLSSLTTSQIQQFLDELSFRECFGQYSLQCFNSIVSKLAVQTKNSVTANCSLETRLLSASLNPFKDWRPPSIKVVETSSSASSVTTKRKSIALTSDQPNVKRIRGRKHTGGRATTKSSSSSTVPKHAMVSVNLEDTALNDISNEDCSECGKKMTNKGHLASYMRCSKCRYSTCCSRAMAIHGLIFHGNNKPEYSLGTTSLMESEMHCVCGFKTNSGNKMAKHLGLHNCKSAYPSAEAATNATLTSDSNAYSAPLVDLKDDDMHMDASILMAKAYRTSSKLSTEDTVTSKDTVTSTRDDTSGPLAFLGLKAKTKSAEKKEHNKDVNEVAKESGDHCDKEVSSPKAKTTSSDCHDQTASTFYANKNIAQDMRQDKVLEKATEPEVLRNNDESRGGLVEPSSKPSEESDVGMQDVGEESSPKEIITKKNVQEEKTHSGHEGPLEDQMKSSVEVTEAARERRPADSKDENAPETE